MTQEHCLIDDAITPSELLNSRDLLCVPREEAAAYIKENLPLKTERTIIRPFSKMCVMELRDIIIRMKEYKEEHKEDGYRVFYYFDNNTPALLSAWNFFRQARDEYNSGETMRLGIFHRETNSLMGNVTVDIPEKGYMAEHLFSSENKKAPLQGDLGYFIDPRYGKKGYMVEALNSIINLYLSLMYPHLTLTVHPDNLPSKKLIRKFSCDQIGYAENSSHNGEPRLIYSIHRGPLTVAKQRDDKYIQNTKHS